MKRNYNSIDYVSTFVPEVTLRYCTPANLLDMGICLCNKCGKTCSVDYKWCSNCKETVVVIVAKKKCKCGRYSACEECLKAV